MQKPAVPPPPEVQQAQEEVWNLEVQLAQSQHDLALLKIQHQETDIQNRLLDAQKRNDFNAISRINQQTQKLEAWRFKEETRLSLRKQQIDYWREGQNDAANSVQFQLNNLH